MTKLNRDEIIKSLEYLISGESNQTPVDYICEIQGVIDLLKEQPRWIPVTERLPDEGVSVIAWEEEGFPYVDWICEGEWVIASNQYAKVTHWMPLPEPPKEEDKE